MTMEQVLIIEDDQRLAQMVCDYLKQFGYSLEHAPNGASGLRQIESNENLKLVILDLMLPDMDGLEVCRQIRQLPSPTCNLSILMLTAKGDPMDRVVGLELGAADYLAKPFEPRELLARMRAILRRQSAAHEHKQNGKELLPTLQFGRLEIDRDARTVNVAGQLCDLTSYQFDLLLVYILLDKDH